MINWTQLMELYLQLINCQNQILKPNKANKYNKQINNNNNNNSYKNKSKNKNKVKILKNKQINNYYKQQSSKDNKATFNQKIHRLPLYRKSFKKKALRDKENKENKIVQLRNVRHKLFNMIQFLNLIKIR